MQKRSFALFTLAIGLGLTCGAAVAEPDAAARDASPRQPGKPVFDKWCAACHAAAPRMPGTASLAVKYADRMPAALEKRADLTPAMVRYFVRNGTLTMPPFRKTEITDAELEALGVYLDRRSSR